ncbi:MAG: type I-A CRISPR-associated protein Cas8a2/Csx9 [Candidatus Bathyarchaeia archaeon]
MLSNETREILQTLYVPDTAGYLAKELVYQAVAYIINQDEEPTEILKKYSRKDSELIISTKLGKNDKDSYNRVFKKWFGGTEAPQNYHEMMLAAINNAGELLDKGLIDLKQSLKTTHPDQLGIQYQGEYAILPALIKQIEYFERSTFGLPTRGGKSMVRLDPVWLALLSLGYLIGFAGYYDGRYYLIFKPGLMQYLKDSIFLKKVMDTLAGLTETHIKKRPSIYKEELYNLDLSLSLAEAGVVIEKDVFPFYLVTAELQGRAYTSTSSFEVNIIPYYDFSVKYLDTLRDLRIEATPTDSFLRSLLEVARKELSGKGISGDTDMTAFLVVKDLHRAISSGNKHYAEETLLRLFRKLNMLSQSGKNYAWARALFYRSGTQNNLIALLSSFQRL